MDTLLGHFGSLKELERASFQELRQFLTRREAEAVIAGLSMASVVDTEEALSGPLDKAEAIYRANLEMRCFRQEVVRVVLLDVQNYWITSVDVCKGTLDESLAHPREIFRPVIVHAAAGFVLVHNHPSGDARPSAADVRLTQRVVKGARILEVGFLDHVIVGRRIRKHPGYFQLSGSGAAVSPRFKRFERRGREQRQEREYALVAESWRERRTSDPQNKGVVARR